MDNFLIELEKHAARQGFTLPGLFRAAGVPRQTLSNWRNGTNSPNFRTLRKLFSVKRGTPTPAPAMVPIPDGTPGGAAA